MFSLMKRIYKKQIDSMINKALYDFQQKSQKEKIEQKNECLLTDFPVGLKVISRSNEPEPLLIGEIVGHEFFGNKQMLCVIKCQKTGKEYIPLSPPVKWDQDKENSLNKLQWWEQWNVMSRNYIISKEMAENKEAKNKTLKRIIV